MTGKSMDEVRKGQIALAVLRNIAKKKGIMINPSSMRRDLGNLAKETDIHFDELKFFIKKKLSFY